MNKGMGDVKYALTIFAVLAGILILVAYFAGSTKVGSTLFSGLNSLALTSQGRTSTGQFAQYPGNAPASGSGG